MKHRLNVSKSLFSIVTLLSISLSFSQVSLCLDKDTMPVIFDHLFPDSSFKKVLDTCMQIWGDLDKLQETYQLPDDHSLLTDLIVGRLIRLKSNIDDIANEDLHKPSSFSLNDFEYLMTIIEALENQYKDAVEDIYRDEKIHHLIHKIRTKLEQLFTDPPISL